MSHPDLKGTWIVEKTVSQENRRYRNVEVVNVDTGVVLEIGFGNNTVRERINVANQLVDVLNNGSHQFEPEEE